MYVFCGKKSISYAEMIIHENGTALTIDSTSKEHAVRLFSAGNLKKWTFDAGSTGAITDTNNNTVLRITSVGHGLTTGDFLTITGLGTAAQNDITAITVINDDTFDCDDISYVTAAQTGTWNQGSFLKAGANAAGMYRVSFSSSSTAALANKTFEWHCYIGTSRQDNLGLRRRFSSTDVASAGTPCLIGIAANDIIWMAITNLTDANNLTHIHANLSLNRF